MCWLTVPTGHPNTNSKPRAGYSARYFRSHEFGQGLILWYKFQCEAVVAIALPSGRWTIIENVPLMASAACTVIFCAWQYQLEVFFGANVIGV